MDDAHKQGGRPVLCFECSPNIRKTWEGGDESVRWEAGRPAGEEWHGDIPEAGAGEQEDGQGNGVGKRRGVGR